MDYTPYNIGICYLSVCAHKSIKPEDLEKQVSMDHPTDVRSEWKLSKDTHFADGVNTNPCVCNMDEERMHYLFSC